jgi:GNAT superfamily N-acetyltransferase
MRVSFPAELRLVRATTAQAAELTAIAFAAKRHWGYPETWIERWRDALTITPQYLGAAETTVACVGGTAAGFVSTRHDRADAWLDHLWVLPAHMQRGIGRRLFTDAEDRVRASGARRLCLEADPHAEGFYARMGMRTVGRIPAVIDGVERRLAKMEMRLR